MTATDIKELFVSANKTLGSVESFTGGNFAGSITKVSGASKFFKGALVTYFTEEKERLIGLNHERIMEYGVVSQEIAGDMAMFGKPVLDVDYCISFTGNAGPSAMEGKPVGEIYIAVSMYSFTQVYKYNLSGTRDEIINHAIELGYEHLKICLNTFK